MGRVADGWRFGVRFQVHGSRQWLRGLFDVASRRVVAVTGRSVSPRHIRRIRFLPTDGLGGLTVDEDENPGYLLLFFRIMGVDDLDGLVEWALPRTTLPVGMVALGSRERAPLEGINQWFEPSSVAAGD